ncbi:fungal-specific transcription factor domain-containing protein [Lophiotrema nucula]|uniref:Fungal-specific transcription factor domain-containing protein n=1 Tax=Lophiotrema nucula TaxID=690887 RepID=A0A6A5YS41_9PLEO|nr:fungal-specific transcription factor domain-containing protein [Lophiotrema nucula]
MELSTEAETTAANQAPHALGTPKAASHGDILIRGQPAKKKQKRNKPTLSCEECVERKTKCDRGRPQCLACLKRQSECKYSATAEMLASAEQVSLRGATRSPARRKQSKPSLGDTTRAMPIQVIHLPSFRSCSVSPLRSVATHRVQIPPTPTQRNQYRSVSLSSSGSSPFLLSNIPYSNQTPSPFFGLKGSAHPFANYWTSRGGLPEVIGVLPAKDQADILVDKYFEAVDPVYPMIHRRNFYADYERFWSLPDAEKQVTDPVLLGLHFVVYAMGTQFINMPQPTANQVQMAEFYVSAAQQALRLSSYLSRASVRTLQAMVLICYFLMNDNHASDAWAFGGILMRQAYAMGLHRDPDIIAPRCSLSDKQQRRKLWQAVLFQDTFLTVLLKLPPTATFSDVRVESLTDELDDVRSNHTTNGGTSDAIINPMSISNIAPTSDLFPVYELSDRQYIRSMWNMANLVQRTLCTPRSLGGPIIPDSQSRISLVAQYHSLWQSFPALLSTSEIAEINELASSNPRMLRQNLFFRSNFWHCVMIIQAEEYVDGGVTCDVKGALEAARRAIQAFFHFWEHLRVDAGVWWVFQHRAFEEALLMARILATQEQPLSPETSGSPSNDPLLALAKEDVRKCLEILDSVGSAPELQKTRTEVLRTAFADIQW